MSEIQLSISNDYVLSKIITRLEFDIFIMGTKTILEHIQPIQGELILVDGNRNVITRPLSDLLVRKASFVDFNNLASLQIPSIPSSTGLSYCTIDFIPLNKHEIYTEEDYHIIYSKLRELYLDFMKENNRVSIMVQHWKQNRRYPHVHILYQRKKGKHNEFQSWLFKQLSEVDIKFIKLDL